MTTAMPVLSSRLTAELARAAAATHDDFDRAHGVRRLFDGDASLWTGGDEGRWLGWLSLPATQLADGARFESLAAEARAEGVTHVLVLGMGGSSLGPEVLRTTFQGPLGAPELLVCDSTDPSQIADLAARAPVATTLVVVASKSGGTLEPNIFQAWFFDRAMRALGAAAAGARFVAITDPGSAMEKVATTNGFRRIFHGIPSVGGRFSVLSDFGMVPAAFAGIDVRRLLVGAAAMARACGPDAPIRANPGVVLASILGACAKAGRDKLTLSASRSLLRLGAWLEQLVAESTGKLGRGMIPVDGEPLGAPGVYGTDRCFVRIDVEGEADPVAEAALSALAAAGHPVVTIRLPDAYALGGELYRWEVATAVLGSILGIHPFDQPDVEASKLATRRLTTAYEASGAFPPEPVLYEGEGMRLFADPRNAAALSGAVGRRRSLVAFLRAHLAGIGTGDYVGLLAYLPMNPSTEAAFRGMQHRIRDAKRVAVCVGFGPRFLHSTGQAYKGGPNSGVFLQLTCDDAADLPVPGKRYTFGVVKAAQARGDLAVLAERGRRALRIHLGADVTVGLERLSTALDAALRAAP